MFKNFVFQCSNKSISNNRFSFIVCWIYFNVIYFQKIFERNYCKVRYLDQPIFYRRAWLGGLKKFLGFWKKFYPFRFAFLLQYESANAFFIFAKTTCSQKIWFLRYGPKTSKQIWMENSLNYNISQKTWRMRLIFWIWLEAKEGTKC